MLACTETTLAAAMAIYGVNQGSVDYQCISAKALKVFCVLLCEGRLVDKFSYLYREFSSGNATNMRLMARRSLSGLLRLFCKLSEFLGESQHFGLYLVDAAVLQCYGSICDSALINIENPNETKTHNGEVGVTEEVFMDWILKEPQVIVWIATFYRLVSSTNVYHNTTCIGCKEPNITGLR